MDQVEVTLGVEQCHYLVIIAVCQGRLGKPVRLTLGKDCPQLVGRHRHQFLARPHQILALVVDGLALRARRNMEDEHPAIGMRHFVKRDLQEKPFVDAGHRALGHVKRLRADHAARHLVGHAENHPAATLVCQRHAVIHQLLEVVTVLGRLELKVLVLGTNQAKGVNLFNGCGHQSHQAFSRASAKRRSASRNSLTIQINGDLVKLLRLPSRSSLPELTEALSVFERKLFLMTTPPRPPALRILMR